MRAVTFTRSAELTWEGDVVRGSGGVKAGSGAFSVAATFPTLRGEPQDTTTPEELLAASHAVCFGIGLRSVIARRGGSASRIVVTATITAEKGPDGIRLRRSHLSGVVEDSRASAQRRFKGSLMRPSAIAQSRQQFAARYQSAMTLRWRGDRGPPQPTSDGGGERRLRELTANRARRAAGEGLHLACERSWRRITQHVRGSRGSNVAVGHEVEGGVRTCADEECTRRRETCLGEPPIERAARRSGFGREIGNRSHALGMMEERHHGSRGSRRQRREGVANRVHEPAGRAGRDDPMERRRQGIGSVVEPPDNDVRDVRRPESRKRVRRANRRGRDREIADDWCFG